jgi:hypothetical protein
MQEKTALSFVNYCITHVRATCSLGSSLPRQSDISKFSSHRYINLICVFVGMIFKLERLLECSMRYLRFKSGFKLRTSATESLYAMPAGPHDAVGCNSIRILHKQHYVTK